MKIILVFVSLIGIAAVAGAIVMGNMTFDGVVVEQPYERGLEWDRENELRAASGLDVSVPVNDYPVGESMVRIMVMHDDGSPYEGPVEVLLTRLETSEYDRNFAASAKGSGMYSSEMVFPRHGAWDMRVSLSSMGNTVVFARRVNVRQN